jgi:hypothetical protein
MCQLSCLPPGIVDVASVLANRVRPIMKLAGQDLTYSSPLWTNEQTLNENAELSQSVSIKTSAFSTKVCHYVMIKMEHCDRFSVLALPSPMTLLELFKLKETRLPCVLGCKSPVLLISGDAEFETQLDYEEGPWTVNAAYKFVASVDQSNIRIGGFCKTVTRQLLKMSDIYMAGCGINAYWLLEKCPISFGFYTNASALKSKVNIHNCFIYGIDRL